MPHPPAPLADRMRPRSLEQFLGQEEVVGEETLLRKAIASDQIPSMIFWGPPGSGKTTLAHIIAKKTDSAFLPLSAVSSGVKDLRTVFATAQTNQDAEKRTILFVDEIHRWNKAQQDALLPFVERGVVTLIGATTENPSFEVRGALLSRCRVFVLHALAPEHLKTLIERALT
ncbi:MAG: AAA family ATPase, partial [Patescibacteria group bacterium]